MRRRVSTYSGDLLTERKPGLIYTLPCVLCPAFEQIMLAPSGTAPLPEGWKMVFSLNTIMSGVFSTTVNFLDGERLIAWCPECWPKVSTRPMAPPRPPTQDLGVG